MWLHMCSLSTDSDVILVRVPCIAIYTTGYMYKMNHVFFTTLGSDQQYNNVLHGYSLVQEFLRLHQSP